MTDTSQSDKRPSNPPDGDGNNGPPPKGSTTLEVYVNVHPSGAVAGGTTVQFRCHGDLKTVNPGGGVTRSTLTFLSGSWSLAYSAPGETADIDITGALSTVSGASASLFVSVAGTYTPTIDATFQDPRTGQQWAGPGFATITATSSIQFATDSACAMASSANTVAVVAKGPDRRVWYSWWELGGSSRPWIPLGSEILTDTTPAAALTGSDHHYLFVFAKASDPDTSLHVNQGTLGQRFVGWDI